MSLKEIFNSLYERVNEKILTYELVFTIGLFLGIGITACIVICGYNEKAALEEEVAELVEEELHHYVTATVYNPVASQCDDSPLVTADCSKIDLAKLEKGEIKWIAVSRDLLERYPYGSVVELESDSDPSINGIYEVHDTMNKRYENYIDILVPTRVKLGKWNDVKIRRAGI